MARIIFNTQTDWVNAMKKAASYFTAYSNNYPYNLLFWTGNTLYSDCNNFQKALFNGRNVYYMAPGTYQQDLSNTGDCTELGLISQCSDVSSNFNLLAKGVPELLYMQGHIGAFIGEEVVINGFIYNCIESTAWTGDFGHTGIIYTYVDGSGRRLNHKGGWVNCVWELHGKPTKWVKYTQVKPTIAEDGEFGSDTITLAQKILRKDHGYVEVDGIISGQEKSLITKYVPSYVAGAWTFEKDGSATVRAIQEVLQKAKVYSDSLDSIWGYNTSLGLQKWLNKRGYSLTEDGIFGPLSCKAYQNFLNKCI